MEKLLLFGENEGKYNYWRGCAFETLCIQHVDDIKRALGISGVKTNCYTWNNLGSEDSAQIDLVIERADNITDICEIKYTDAAFTMDKSYEEKLLHKRDVFKNVTKTSFKNCYDIRSWNKGKGLH